MATVTKYRCDFCKREEEDPHLVNGWITVQGSISRSWGVRARGREGDARADYLGGNPEFCSVECMVAALDAYRRMKRGPDPNSPRPDNPMIVSDPFKEKPKGPPPKPKPWEEPPVLSDDEQPPVFAGLVAPADPPKGADDMYRDLLDDGSEPDENS